MLGTVSRKARGKTEPRSRNKMRKPSCNLLELDVRLFDVKLDCLAWQEWFVVFWRPWLWVGSSPWQCMNDVNVSWRKDYERKTNISGRSNSHKTMTLCPFWNNAIWCLVILDPKSIPYISLIPIGIRWTVPKDYDFLSNSGDFTANFPINAMNPWTSFTCHAVLECLE